MCAKKFFHLSNKVKTFCEDAQWWIQKDTNKYDVIIMDVFNGEEPPSYLLTYENFLQLKNLLRDQNSLLIINWYGYYTSYLGKSTRILINTLHQAGFYTSFIPTNKVESHSNLVIFASTNQIVLSTNAITIKPENEINTQDKNVLSLLNANANYQWRKGYLKFIEYWWR
jgi:spermidine synthase